MHEPQVVQLVLTHAAGQTRGMQKTARALVPSHYAQHNQNVGPRGCSSALKNASALQPLSARAAPGAVDTAAGSRDSLPTDLPLPVPLLSVSVLQRQYRGTALTTPPLARQEAAAAAPGTSLPRQSARAATALCRK